MKDPRAAAKFLTATVCRNWRRQINSTQQSAVFLQTQIKSCSET